MQEQKKNRYHFTLRIFFHLLGVIYFIAFASLFVQVKGLYGSKVGLEPVDVFLERAKQR